MPSGPPPPPPAHHTATCVNVTHRLSHTHTVCLCLPVSVRICLSLCLSLHLFWSRRPFLCLYSFVLCVPKCACLSDSLLAFSCFAHPPFSLSLPPSPYCLVPNVNPISALSFCICFIASRAET